LSWPDDAARAADQIEIRDGLDDTRPTSAIAITDDALVLEHDGRVLGPISPTMIAARMRELIRLRLACATRRPRGSR
jgi:hypothetical protein